MANREGTYKRPTAMSSFRRDWLDNRGWGYDIDWVMTDSDGNPYALVEDKHGVGRSASRGQAHMYKVIADALEIPAFQLNYTPATSSSGGHEYAGFEFVVKPLNAYARCVFRHKDEVVLSASLYKELELGLRERKRGLCSACKSEVVA